MAEFLAEFWANQWAWFLIAVVLLGLELLAAGVVFMWLAVAAAIVRSTETGAEAIVQ